MIPQALSTGEINIIYVGTVSSVDSPSLYLLFLTTGPTTGPPLATTEVAFLRHKAVG